jgi:hypothetical protein
MSPVKSSHPQNQSSFLFLQSSMARNSLSHFPWFHSQTQYSHIVRRKFQLSRTPNNTEASRNSAQESKGTASQLDDPQIKDARFAVLLTGQIFESSRRRGRRAARSRRTRTRGTRPPLRSSSTRRRHLPPSTGPDSGPRRKHERFRGGGGSMKRRGWRSMW